MVSLVHTLQVNLGINVQYRRLSHFLSTWCGGPAALVAELVHCQ